MAQTTTDRTSHRSRIEPATESRSVFLRWAGWTGLIGTVAFIITIVMSSAGAPSPDGPGDMVRFLDDVAGNGAMEYVYGIAGIVLSLLYIPLAIGVYRLLARSTVAWFGSAAVAVGLLVLFPAYVINLLAPAALVPVMAELGTAGSGALYADYQVARAIAEILFTVGSILTLAVGPLLWGYEWLRSSRRGLGLTGLLTGITGMVWFVWLLDSAVVGVVLIANVLVSLIFFTWACVALISPRGVRRAEAT